MGSLFLSTGVSQASISESSARFLLIHHDVRSRAMGEAGVSLPGLDFAIDINPAQLLQPQKVTAGFSRGDFVEGGATDWESSTVDDWSSWSAYATIGPGLVTGHSGPRWALGVGYKRFDLTYHPYSDPFGNLVSALKQHQSAMMVGAALGVEKHLSVGASFKIIQDHLRDEGAGAYEVEATGWALDFGLYFSNLLPQATACDSWGLYPASSFWTRLQAPRDPGFSLGLVVQNLGPNISYIDPAQSDPLPRILRLGASYRLLDSDLLGILGTGEYKQSLVSSDDWFESGEFSLHWGVEFGVLRLVDFRYGRFGVAGDTGSEDESYGLGVGLERIRFNFSHVDYGWNDSDDMNIWSIDIKW